MSVKKWMDYYGAIRLVTLDQNKDGEFTGAFVCESIGCGISFATPDSPGTKEPDPSLFFDTFEEAQKGIARNFEERIKEMGVVIQILERVIGRNKEGIVNLQRCIEEIKKQEHFR